MPVLDNDTGFFQNKKTGLLCIICYLLFVICEFYFLVISKTGATLLSPWRTIHPAYIYVFFASTFVLGLLVFFSIKVRYILLLLVIHSFLLHSYLPLTHQLLYGADGWRHIANEERMLAGLPFLEPQLAAPITANLQSTVYSLQTLIGRLSYSELWGVSAVISKIGGFDLITINKWLLPILWSIAIPLLLFQLGRKLGWNERQSLLLAWLSSLPFAFQAAGSFTLPVNFGFILWLFALVLIARHIAHPERKFRYLLLLLGIIFLFSYNLFFVLFWLAWAVGEAVLHATDTTRQNQTGGHLSSAEKRSGRGLACSFLWPFTVPLIIAGFMVGAEMVAGFSTLPTTIHVFSSIKQLIGNFTALYLAAGPRPHDIATGNIIFNQVPNYAFVVNAFTQWRWWLVGFMILFWGVVVYGAWKSWCQRGRGEVMLLLFGVGLFSSYIISRYFLVGEHVLTRRLDVVLALFLLLFLAKGLFVLVERYHYRASVVVIGVAVFTAAIAASYSLGPDTQTVSSNEYAAMQYVWSQEKNNITHCVLAYTYPLLALETISGKEIIGGGFPISSTFAQPERENLLATMLANPATSTWSAARNLTRANTCWLVVKKNDLLYNEVVNADAASIHVFGDTAAWQYAGLSMPLKSH